MDLSASIETTSELAKRALASQSVEWEVSDYDDDVRSVGSEVVTDSDVETESKSIFRICVVGAEKVGKSSLISRYFEDEDDLLSSRKRSKSVASTTYDYDAMNSMAAAAAAKTAEIPSSLPGSRIKKIQLHKYLGRGDDCYFEIFECPSEGHPSYSENFKMWFNWADGFLLCYDITNSLSFEALSAVYHRQITAVRKLGSACPMILVGTHADREGKRKVNRSVAVDLSRKFDCPNTEISPKEKVDGLFYTLYKELKMVELRGSRSRENKPALARRSSAADTQRIYSPPALQRRMSEDEGQLGRSLVLEKNWELYKKDIEEAQKSTSTPEIRIETQSQPVSKTEEEPEDDKKLKQVKSLSPSEKPSEKKTLRSIVSGKLKIPSALTIKGKGSLRGFDENDMASVETEALTWVREELERDATWNSKDYIPKKWDDSEMDLEQTLIELSCKKEGFVLEFGREVNDIVLDIEEADNDVKYYEENFAGKDHLNLVSNGEESKSVGPIIISVPPPSQNSLMQENKKCLMRTKKGNKRFLLPWNYSYTASSMIKYIKGAYPSLVPIKFSEISDPALTTELIKYEKQEIWTKYKFGLLYVKEGQTDEDQIFGNNDTSQEYEDFLSLIGEKIQLENWKNFKGGLDVKTNSTGTHSVYATLHNFEIMFHVSTLLPYQENDQQKVERKRHIGNDVVVLIFKDGSSPFDPRILTSHFNHIFIVVQVDRKENGKVFYRCGVAHKPGVPMYGPPLPSPAIFEGEKFFQEFLLTKMINAERSAMHSPEFRDKLERTRKTLLTELANQFVDSNKRKNSNLSKSANLIPAGKESFVDDELKEKITKRLEKWNVTAPTKSVTATFREKTVSLLSALDSKLFYSEAKNFDGIDFMYSLSTALQHCISGASLLTSERKTIIQDNVKILVPMGANFIYVQEMRKKDIQVENQDEVYKLFKENLNALQDCVDTLTKQQENEVEAMNVEMQEKKKMKKEQKIATLQEKKKKKEEKKMIEEEKKRVQKEKKKEEELKKRQDEEKKQKEKEEERRKIEERRKLIEDQKRKLAELEEELRQEALDNILTGTEDSPKENSPPPKAIDPQLKVLQIGRERRSSEAPPVLQSPSTTVSKVTEFLKEGERVFASLTTLLNAVTIDIGELRLLLRGLGMSSRGAYEAVGNILTKEQINEITTNTQSMVQIGVELKNTPSADSPEKRKELLQAAEKIVHVMKEIVITVQ